MSNCSVRVPTGPFTTHCECSGQGRDGTILFLHGSGPGVTAWSNWQSALPVLGDHFQCLALDLVGFGATDHPQAPPAGIRNWMRLWVDQCLALLDARRLQKVHLVGNSMGGAIALHLMMEAPERFERVVLMGSIGTPHKLTPELDRLWGFYDDPSVKVFRNIVRWFVYDEKVFADRLDAMAHTRFAAAANPEVQRSFQAMFPAPRQSVIDDLVVPELALRRMDHPVLLVHGRDDKIVPLETSLHLLHHLPRVQLHVFGQCSHWTQIELAKCFNQLLAQFFSGQP